MARSPEASGPVVASEETPTPLSSGDIPGLGSLAAPFWLTKAPLYPDSFLTQSFAGSSQETLPSPSTHQDSSSRGNRNPSICYTTAASMRFRSTKSSSFAEWEPRQVQTISHIEHGLTRLRRHATSNPASPNHRSR